MGSLRAKTIRLAYHQPELRPLLLPILGSPRFAADADAPTDREISVATTLMVNAWVDGFFDLLAGYRMTPAEIEIAITQAAGRVDTEELNEVYARETGLDLAAIRTAGAMDTVSAFGGNLLRGAWHMITEPFQALWNLITSPEYRAKIKTSILRAVNHEVRSTRHMVGVAVRLLRGEPVKPEEIKTAAIQFLDIATKVLLVWFVGPHIAQLFSGGVVKALLSLLSPLDEIAGILLDRPIRWVTRKFLGQAIGMLPSGFYTHW